MFSQFSNLDMDEAFVRLRSHARNHNVRLSDVATNVVVGNLPMESLDRPKK